jgi:hypothetical protein
MGWETGIDADSKRKYNTIQRSRWHVFTVFSNCNANGTEMEGRMQLVLDNRPVSHLDHFERRDFH